MRRWRKAAHMLMSAVRAQCLFRRPQQRSTGSARHRYLTEAEGAPLSRWAVFYAFPVFITAALWMRHMIFFKRIRLADKEAFNRRLEAQFQRTYTNGMIVYPEGHRSTKAESLPLKRGILHFTYSRGYKTQVIITRGKEQLLSEKRLAVHFGARLACGYGAVIDPAAHSDFDAFVAEVQRQWDALWRQVYGADVEALPELQVGVGGSASQTFPRGVLLGQAAICTASIVLFAAMLWAAARVIAASAWTMTGAAVLAGWTAVAMSRAELKPGEGL